MRELSIIQLFKNFHSFFRIIDPAPLQKTRCHFPCFTGKSANFVFFSIVLILKIGFFTNKDDKIYKSEDNTKFRARCCQKIINKNKCYVRCVSLLERWIALAYKQKQLHGRTFRQRSYNQWVAVTWTAFQGWKKGKDR